MLVLTLVVTPATPVPYSLFDDASKIRLWRWRRSRAVAAATATLLALAIVPGSATAQTVQPAPATLAPATQPTLAADRAVKITRDDAVRLAVENNPDLAAARYGPAISDQNVAAARGAFVPTLNSAWQRNSQLQPPISLFAGNEGLQTDIWSGNAGVSQLLWWGGGTYSAGWDAARTTTDNLISSLNPELGSGITLSFSQPLLRDFKTSQPRAQVELNRRARDIAGSTLRETTVATSTNAERTYWALVAAIALVDVQQRALDLALELERNNQARVDVGQSPPLDLVAARAEVAQRRENVIVARTTARQTEDVLRTLVVDPARDDFWSIRIEPADRVPGMEGLPDTDAAVRRALAERTDLARARTDIQVSDTNITLSKSDTLPDLRVQATYLTDGAGGRRLIREGGFPGTIVGSESSGFGSVLNQVFANDYPSWTVGMTFSYPLGKSTAEANLARARLERDQNAARLRALEVAAVREVREVALRLEQNHQRIETTGLARELAEQRLDAEQRRFDVGMSTSFLVIQAQRDLAIARNNELQAQLDYQLARVSFEAVQQAGGGQAER